MKNKIKRLEEILHKLKRVAIAFSGGVDSTYLLKKVKDVLGPGNVIAVTARSETYPNSEFIVAKNLAKKIGVRHIIINTKELELKNFRDNPPDRCYYCKTELFSKIKNIGRKFGIENCVDATNYDDRLDMRFGRIAARELGVKSPLFEAKITKDEIRKDSKNLGLSTYNKPSFACLASRFPYNQRITEENLRKVAEGEDFLRKLGLWQVRLRVHKNVARIETGKDNFGLILKKEEEIVKNLKKRLGFKYVTLDLEGYRTGSMNEVLKLKRADKGFLPVDKL